MTDNPENCRISLLLAFKGRMTVSRLAATHTCCNVQVTQRCRSLIIKMQSLQRSRILILIQINTGSVSLEVLVIISEWHGSQEYFKLKEVHSK